VLKEDIQINTHDSAEDARTAMALMKVLESPVSRTIDTILIGHGLENDFWILRLSQKKSFTAFCARFY
jgi:hypothetical protein